MLLRQFLFAALAAGVLVTAPAAAFAAESLNPAQACPGCYLVTDQITGYVLTGSGDGITITPTSEAIAAGTAVPVAWVRWRGTKLGEKASVGYPQTLPPTLNPSIIDTAALPAATPQSGGMDRQARLVFDRPSAPGSLTTHPVINPARELAAQGKPLAPNQLDWLKAKVAKEGDWVPGTLYVTLFLRPGDNGPWRVAHWNYLFAPKLDLALTGMPAPECPPGSPGTWPKCGPTPPPPPGGNPQAGLDLAVERLSVSDKTTGGRKGPVSFFVHRLAGAEGTDTTVEVWIGGVKACSKTIGIPPGPGARIPVSCEITAPAADGAYSVTAVVNPGHDPEETRYDNNRATTPMNVVSWPKPDTGGTKTCLGDWWCPCCGPDGKGALGLPMP